MQTRILILFTGILLVFGLTSCDSCQSGPVGSSDALQAIPGDAVAVIRADVPTLMEKMNFERVKNSPEFKEAMQDLTQQNPILADVLQNIETSGIDASQAAYSYIQLDPEKISESFSAAVVSLTDASQFETLIREYAKADELEVKEGYSVWKQSKMEIVAWNDQYALFGTSQRFIDLEARARQVLNPEAEEITSIAENKDLQKAFSEPHDILLWFSSNSFADAPQAQMALGLAEFEADALKDNFIHGYIDFEEGAITGKLLPHLKRALTKDIDKLFNEEVETDFSAYVHPERSLLLMTAALNMDGVNEIIQARTQAKGFLEFGLKKYGLTLTEVTSALGGDVLFSTLTTDEDRVAGLFGTNITNGETFAKLLQAGIEQGVLMQEDEFTYAIRQIGFNQGNLTITFDDGLARLVIVDDRVFISGDEAILETVKAGGFDADKQVASSTWSEMAANIFWSVIDLENIYSRKLTNFEDEKVSEIRAQANREEVDFTFEMIDQERNALEVLVEGEGEVVQ